MSIMQTIETKWEQWRRPLFGFILGLVVGPFLSGFVGWQVLTNTMEENVENAVAHQQAEICAYLARQEVQNSSELSYSERQELAEEYAQFPWDDSVGYSVESECSGILAREPAADAADKS